MQKRIFSILSVLAAGLFLCSCGRQASAGEAQAEENPLAGSWTWTADISRTVSAPYLEYLGDYAECFSCENLTVSITIEFKEDGTWTQAADEGSLQACIDRAESAFESALETLAQEAVTDSGAALPEGTTADTIAEQALGMTLADYVQIVKPDMSSACESILTSYLQDGTYTLDIDSKTLYRGTGDEAPSAAAGENWLMDGNTLVLISSDGTVCTALHATER